MQCQSAVRNDMLRAVWSPLARHDERFMLIYLPGLASPWAIEQSRGCAAEWATVPCARPYPHTCTQKHACSRLAKARARLEVRFTAVNGTALLRATMMNS